jgi:hypothetical protein
MGNLAGVSCHKQSPFTTSNNETSNIISVDLKLPYLKIEKQN